MKISWFVKRGANIARGTYDLDRWVLCAEARNALGGSDLEDNVTRGQYGG